MFDLLEVLKDKNTIGITGHVRPDGDCVGSTMAMYLYLTKEFPEKRVDIFLELVPESCRFVKGCENVRTDFKTDVDSYDAFLVIDCEAKRSGGAEALYNAAKCKINIDHHISNPGCGDINYVVPTASSAAEVVYDLFLEEKMDKDIALSLYLGMIHDSGVFQYSNTSPKTLNMAAKLISYGFDFSKLIEESFYQKSFKQNKLLGKALTDSELLLDGHIICSVISRKTMEEFDAKPSDFEGIVSQMRNTKGVDNAIFAYELENGQYKLSLRTSDRVDATIIAKVFDGGGHKKAAGFTADGPIEEVITKISDMTKQQLELPQP